VGPKAQIGDIVKLKCFVQTNYGFDIVHLTPREKYFVIDIKAQIMLSSGEVSYIYLLSNEKEMGRGSSMGWVSEESILEEEADIKYIANNDIDDLIKAIVDLIR